MAPPAASNKGGAGGAAGMNGGLAAEEGAKSAKGPYNIDADTLSRINENKDNAAWDQLGGPAGVAAALDTSLADGVASGSVAARRAAFGANALPTVPTKSFFALWFGNLRDPILVMLMAAALVSTVLGIAIPVERADSAWVEGVAIWVAVAVVSLVGAGNDWNKDRQFQRLNAQRDVIEVKVVRGGRQATVLNTELVVGDLLQLDTGDKVVADCWATEVQNLTLDEASLTGEADPIKKGAGEGDPWVRSGTQVTEGSGRALVVAVGERSEWGRTMALVVGEAGPTPLQEKLGVLAAAIGKIGFAVALLCFVVLMIRWLVDNNGFPLDQFSEGPLEFFIFAVTIVVVAVPEGLPLAVTISLAYSMGKMMRDNNFVRVLAACETMGGATAICSDKTGTLTENRMTVVEGWFASAKHAAVPAPAELPPGVHDEVVRAAALNSKAFLTEDAETGAVGFVGNRTECALLMMLRGWGDSYADVRALNKDAIKEVYGFTSERKMGSVLVRAPGGGLRLYNKGAAEIIIARCTAAVGADGRAAPLAPAARDEMGAMITAMASRGLRTLCLAYREWSAAEAAALPPGYFDRPPAGPAPVEADLTALCVVGIKDPVRKEVPAAVATCQRAGIRVRMVTGDNVHTARHIARECGILTEGGLAMEGPDFRKLSEPQLMEVLPRLQVLARSSPLDKFVLVRTLKKMGEVVAVTGDGTNDAPALKESDVGLAMGIAGTEVAKEAADIVILDDNFSSIVKSVLWGRSVFSNIRKFLQFQLTINLVALVVAFVAAVTTGETPLNVLQLLWVNLIMDSLAALALATEDPTPELLAHRPHGRNEPLINGRMFKHIAVQSAYQCFWLFLIFYGLPAQNSAYAVRTRCEYLSQDYFAAGAVENGNPALCCLAPEQAASGVAGPPPPECLVANGGYYLPGEPLMCALADAGGSSCNWEKPELDAYCGVGDDAAGACTQAQTDRYNAAKSDYDDADSGYDDAKQSDVTKTNSMVFNTFIFMQVFNEVSSRKIGDEYNLFEGFFKSWIFATVLAITVGAQLIIMFFLGGIFHVNRLSWQEWVVSIAIGAGGMVLSLFTRWVSNTFFPTTLDDEARRNEELQRQPVRYREHFWQVFRPPRPKEAPASKYGEAAAAAAAEDAAAAVAAAPSPPRGGGANAVHPEPGGSRR